MGAELQPTERELEILKVLWNRGEATVREVYEELSQTLPIVQNTVQAFLRTMEQKELVTHRLEGRTFIYRPVPERDQTTQHMLSGLLQRVFDGAMDQLVASAFSVRQPTPEELERLEALIAAARQASENSPTERPKQ